MRNYFRDHPFSVTLGASVPWRRACATATYSMGQRSSIVARFRPFATGIWGGILVGTGAYLYTRQIPLQLKIIQARIIAQAGLIFGAWGV